MPRPGAIGHAIDDRLGDPRTPIVRRPGVFLGMLIDPDHHRTARRTPPTASEPGIITGASPKGTYVRLMKFPAEGRIVKEASGCDVGEKVHVRLIAVEISQGFIDFERC